MTLRADLAALLAKAGIPDADLEEALDDEHARARLYQRIIAAVTESRRRDDDRVIVATILRDPMDLTAKTAVVGLVDGVAMGTADPAGFRRWADRLVPEFDRCRSEGSREFLRRRVDDWTVFLTIKAGRTPDPGDLTGATAWMQRLIAERSTSLPALTVLAESGRTRKIRDLASDRAGTLTRRRP